MELLAGQVLTLDSVNVIASHQLARALYRLRRFDESISAFAAAIKLGDPAAFLVKYDAAASGYHYMHDGTVTIFKDSVVFDPSSGIQRSTVELSDVDARSPDLRHRMEVVVQIPDPKSGKKRKLAYQVYPRSAATIGGAPGGTGLQADCRACDAAETRFIFDLLRRLKSPS